MHQEKCNLSVNFICNKCGKQFSGPDNLRRHILMMHSGQEKHQSKHEGEGVKYEHACNQCDYRATQKGNLTMHIKSKHKDVKFACNLCDFQGSKEAIRYHLKIKHI